MAYYSQDQGASIQKFLSHYFYQINHEVDENSKELEARSQCLKKNLFLLEEA